MDSLLEYAPSVATAVALAAAGGFALMQTAAGAQLKFILTLLKFKTEVVARTKMPEWNIIDFWNDRVKRTPNNLALTFVGTDETYTYADMDRESNKVAQWAVSMGLKKGDTVALVMENRPEFLFFELGLAKAGVAIGFINTNLKLRPLAHALSVCLEHSSKKVVIFGSEMQQNISTVEGNELLTSDIEWFCSGGAGLGGRGADLDKDLARQSTEPVDPACRKGIAPTDPVFYIYTSGTTGLPKAAKITHVRAWAAGYGFSLLIKSTITEKDKIYCCLPVYHSAGGLIGFGMAWSTGASVVLRKKFSASNFIPDCRKYGCTVVQYIGELCRYVVNTPASDEDKNNSIRVACGNGLRPEIWDEFKNRFGIDYVFEFYASTEGNANLFNSENKTGAVGYLPALMAMFYPVKLIKFDHESEEPVRGPDGMCIECDANEAGECIGLIDDKDPTRRFDGYTNKEATEKKILRDVFKKGDKWFRSGDLLRRDAQGFVYFVDRIGDTFRWKGENVSTMEVSEVVSTAPGILEANVYGVQVPNQDGRAGMAALAVDGAKFSLDSLYTRVSQELPAYARPLFLRVGGEVEITGTFKHRKVDWQKDGFDPAVIKDEVYFRDDGKKAYVKVDAAVFKSINEGTTRV